MSDALVEQLKEIISTQRPKDVRELVTNDEEEEAARVELGIRNYFQDEKDKKEYEKLRRRDPSLPPDRPLPPVPAGVTLKASTDYFRYPSSNPVITRAMEAFRIQAGGQDIGDLATEFLVEHYARLVILAEEKRVSDRFLKFFRDEFTRRKIFFRGIEKRVKDRKKRETQSATGNGTLNLDGITDTRLLSEGNQINHQIDQLGEQEGFLSAAYDRVAALMAGGPGGVPIAEKQLLLDQIGEALYRARLPKVQEQLRQHASQESTKTGFYGERVIRPIDKQDMLEDVRDIARWHLSDRAHNRLNDAKALTAGSRKAKTMFDIFNNMFQYSDTGLREEFGHAMGTAGGYSKEKFFQALQEMKSELEEEYVHSHSHEVEAQIEVVRRFIERFDQEYKMRELLHNAFYIAEGEGEFKDFAGYCKQFASEFGDLAFLNSPEVEAALRIRESVLYAFRRENNGRIPPELVTYNPARLGSEWEDRTERILGQMNEQGLFSETGEGRIAEWRIKRAISLSRGLGMVLLRFPSIVAEAGLDAPPSFNQAAQSSAWEKLVWGLNPMLVPQKYGQGFGMRGFLYAAKTRTKKGILHPWSQDELRNALAQEAVSIMCTMGDDESLINMRNMFNSGGPFNHTGWRPYVAALEEDRGALRDSLARNPGLAMNMLFNRYEHKGGYNEARYNFWKLHEHDMTAEQRLKAWEGELKRLKRLRGGDADYKARERQMWRNAAGRVPQVIFRVISDPYNRILNHNDAENLRRSLCTAMGISPTDKEAWTQVEEDLVLAKEGLMRRRQKAKETRAPLTEAEDQLLPEDFALITDGTRRARAIAFRDAFVSYYTYNNALLDRLVEKADNDEFAFEVTAEDIPWSEFVLGQTGPRGFFTRKINDALTCSDAGDQLQTLIKHMAQYHGPEQIVEQLQKIYDAIEIYSKEGAQKAIATIAIGIIRFYEKDGLMKIPLLGEFMGPINAINHRGASFAQTMYGGRAMAWDSDDIYAFTEMLRGTLSDASGFDLIQEVRKETGGTLWQAIGKKTKIAIYLLLLFGSAEMIEKILKEK